MRDFLLRYCPVVREIFWPTIWCVSSRCQTVLAFMFRSRPSIPYEREIVATPDGGQFALDWVHGNVVSTSTPIVLLLCGVAGKSDNSYIRHMALQVQRLGYRAVVFNKRGLGGVKLLTPKLFSACETDDLRVVMATIKRRYPRAPVAAAGVSFGGLNLIHYLAETGDKSGLVGAMSISAGFDIDECMKCLEKPVNRTLFLRRFIGKLNYIIKENRELFEKDYDVDHILQSKAMSEFNSRFTVKNFGYRDLLDYYTRSSTRNKLQHVRIPLLCLLSADDEFIPYHTIPFVEVNSSEYVAMVTTSRGGHIGFLESCIPRHENYLDRVFAQWTDAVFKHSDVLRKTH